MERIYRAAKYIRTSCPGDELNFRDSATNQTRIIDNFLRAHPEILVVAERVDNGYSGVTFDRPALNEMIADIETGHVDCVIVKDLSRLGRNYVETGKHLRDLFEAKGVRFISIDDNIDFILMDVFDKVIVMIKNIFSEQYSYDVSVKTRNALNVKRKRGDYVGAAPIYGYQKSDDNKHKLALDLNTYTVVQNIFSLKLQGVSAAGIASELNNSGILSPIAYKRKLGLPHPTGGFADKDNARWSATTILRILRDENYTGTLVQGRQCSYNYKLRAPLTLDESEWAKTENSHPPIVSKADYDTVQRVLALDTRVAPKHSEVYIFSGLLVCGCCGGNMTRKTVRSSRWQYIYYYCPTGKRNGCMAACIVSEKVLLRMVNRKVKERIADIQKLARRFSATHTEKLLKFIYARQIDAQSQKIRDMQNFRARLHDSLACGIIDNEEFCAFKHHYNGEITKQNAEVILLQRKLSYSEEQIDPNTNYLCFENKVEVVLQLLVK